MASVCRKTGSSDARVVGEGQGLGAALEPEDTPSRGHSTELLALASPTLPLPGCLQRTCDDKLLLSGLHSAHLSHLPGVQDELHTAVALMSAKLHGLGGGLQTQTSPGAGRNRPERAWARETRRGRWELWRAGNTSSFQRGPHSASPIYPLGMSPRRPGLLISCQNSQSYKSGVLSEISQFLNVGIHFKNPDLPLGPCSRPLF